MEPLLKPLEDLTEDCQLGQWGNSNTRPTNGMTSSLSKSGTDLNVYRAGCAWCGPNLTCKACSFCWLSSTLIHRIKQAIGCCTNCKSKLSFLMNFIKYLPLHKGRNQTSHELIQATEHYLESKVKELSKMVDVLSQTLTRTVWATKSCFLSGPWVVRDSGLPKTSTEMSTGIAGG